MYYNTINDLNNPRSSTMIYQTIDFNSFQRAFINAGRSDQFSAKGLEMLFNYIEELSNGTEQGMELDVIALCCQYSELGGAGYLLAYREEDGMESFAELEQALINGDLDRVIAYDLDNNVILVNDDY